MIITLTLNPAIDKTIEVNNFTINHVNRISKVRIDPGGKGINVSKVIQKLGGDSKALGVLAGRSGDFIKDQLDRLGIDHDFISINGETRTNIKIVDREENTNTDINEKGPLLTLEDLQKVMDKLFFLLNPQDILVLSGSVPSNVEDGIYQKIIAKAKKRKVKTILDADGSLLRQGIEAGPYLVKPNIHELERVYQQKILNTEKAIECAKNIFKHGVEIVVLSLGGEGAIFMTKEQTIKVGGIKVDVISTVGAGDAMVAALALAIHRGYSLEKAIKLSIATSAASVMTAGTEAGHPRVVEQLEEHVHLDILRS
ncbi:1-phosphofructokinase [Irregularibacter muris]|uniref:Tagatose-6-phosphate kinase n=1 Tax=Irregularibacter muris TaxID=1796619 RepID=A0AAE3L3I0_9FIRM|nr:1-phosphofructokinase [Irregularibacter muris]MCR1898293.1 1-phosphofructokinase [Irregularibacter muris]